jgi:RNA polymerase sigma factor (sigma-70 family)
MPNKAARSLGARLWDCAVLSARHLNQQHTRKTLSIIGKRGAWRRWRREREILALMPMVDRIARDVRWMFAPHLELSDLTQAGNLGLVRAANAFEPAKAGSAGFESYAYFRVRGAIIDAHKRRAYREEANISLQAFGKDDGWLPPALDTDPRPLPDAIAARDQIRRRLQEAVDDLPEIEGRVLRAQLDGQPVRAVAHEIGMSPAWTRTKLAEAKALVARQMRP